MTTPVDPFTFAWAARCTIDLIGNAKASALVGKSEDTLSAWKHRTNPRWPRIDQALALDLAYAAAGGDGLPFLDSFQALANQARESEACWIKFAADCAALSKDQGEFNAAAFNVMLPGATQRDADRCMVEVQEVMTRAGAIVRRIKSICRWGAGSRSQMSGGIS
jgi:hypothetical protein